MVSVSVHPTIRIKQHPSGILVSGTHPRERVFLRTTVLVDFGRVEVALRIGRHVVKNVKLTRRFADASAEVVQNLERLPIEDCNFLMSPIEHVQKSLLRIGGKRRPGC